ncbi:protein adenylyltransferase SelO [Piscinibacter gummiphilus]|uniref:Protein nucleotidyltransferase YdiU n=1 Tax=Piscinibacter gummiphilus TaxID=946333 RepID=A0ABZ0D197_9BURK|nr:YdiU family protein [Piscinibacter gummiphilus]WOB10521.1 YdiU family protein [Piscinibacter gummiphilus]
MVEVFDGAEASVVLERRWPNRFATLGDRFYTPMQPQGLPEPHWVAWSERCAELLGWQGQRDGLLQVLSGNASLPGMQPLASVYSGHQFGVWAGQLGDGRAHLLGELDTPSGPMEIQLKGAGLTPYSRMGDGRAVLRSSIREFLCSEAMAALGVPTTRALCITGSALPVRRETVETAAVVTRVAPSFIRFGHFEHFTHTAEDTEALRQLADFVIAHHYPECATLAQPYAALLEAVARKMAELMAWWQAVGFCHGVMNTDNMSILGLTIDYGPFGFLDAFDPGHVCNHSDHQGRYAYARQPNVGFWNVHALAQGLMPLIDDAEAALAALEPYKTAFPQALTRQMRAKLGLATAHDGDMALIDGLLKCMAADRADFSITFRRLAQFNSAEGASNDVVRDMFLDRPAFDAWAQAYGARLRAEGSVDAERAQRMNRVNPKFVLRNHLAEVAIRAAEQGDFSETHKLLKVLERPYDEQPEHSAYADFPPEWAQSIEVSCSS